MRLGSVNFPLYIVSCNQWSRPIKADNNFHDPYLGHFEHGHSGAQHSCSATLSKEN